MIGAVRTFLLLVMLLLSQLLIFPSPFAESTGRIDHQAFSTIQEQGRFNYLLKKHGLKGRVSVVYDWPDAPWFHRKHGKRWVRVRFK